MTSLEGKVALVTGAASGIGQATAIAMARRGASVVLSDIDGEKAGDTLAAIAALPQDAAAPFFVRSDVASESDVEELFRQIRTRFGRLDIACNIAGVGGRKDGPMFAPIADARSADFDFVFAVNVRGLWLCMREEMKMMGAQKSGAIVNLSSVMGKAGMAGVSIYSGTKHAVIGMTRSVALEGASCGVRVNAVCPGTIATPLVDALVGTEGPAREDLAAAHPIGRIGAGRSCASHHLAMFGRGILRHGHGIGCRRGVSGSINPRWCFRPLLDSPSVWQVRMRHYSAHQRSIEGALLALVQMGMFCGIFRVETSTAVDVAGVNISNRMDI